METVAGWFAGSPLTDGIAKRFFDAAGADAGTPADRRAETPQTLTAAKLSEESTAGSFSDTTPRTTTEQVEMNWTKTPPPSNWTKTPPPTRVVIGMDRLVAGDISHRILLPPAATTTPPPTRVPDKRGSANRRKLAVTGEAHASPTSTGSRRARFSPSHNFGAISPRMLVFTGPLLALHSLSPGFRKRTQQQHEAESPGRRRV